MPALKNNWKRTLMLARSQRAMLIFLYLLVLVQLQTCLAWLRTGTVSELLPWAWFVLVWCVFYSIAFAYHALYDAGTPLMGVWLPIIAAPVAGVVAVLFFNTILARRFRDEFGLRGFWLGVSHKALRWHFEDAACKGCGYNLTGVEGPRCPECGRATYLTSEDRVLLRRRRAAD